MSKSKPVRSFARGLDVLRALNARNFATVSQLAQATGLPRATVHRLLETLIGEGYVTRSQDYDIYSLREPVIGLSSGMTAGARAADLSRPLVDALSEAITWPLDVLTLEGDSLRVRHSTHGRCPRSLLSRSSTGVKLPLPPTAPGRIFLALLPEDERAAFVSRAGDAAGPDMHMVEQAGALGYGMRDGGLLPRTTSISVAVCNEGRPVACISAMFMRAAMTLEEAVERYLPPMREMAGEVEARLAA